MNAPDTAAALLRFFRRLAAYLAVWVLAAIVLEVVIKPAGATETNLTALEQRLLLPLYTPFIIFIGLSISFARPIYFVWANAGEYRSLPPPCGCSPWASLRLCRIAAAPLPSS